MRQKITLGVKNSQTLFRRSINGGQFFEVLFRAWSNVYSSQRKRFRWLNAPIDAEVNFNSPVEKGLLWQCCIETWLKEITHSAVHS